VKNFWRWVRDEATGERTLYLSGPIAEETWWGDEVTPAAFRSELLSGAGPVTVWINSPGGCVFAAAQIYNMLMEYNGPVTVKIDGIAASAASVIAMAGGEVHMSPVSMLMIHNPATVAVGDSEEMLRAKALLDEVKESIINAYELKTGLSRAKLSHFMDNETWMNANKAVELGFADKIMFADAKPGAGTETEFAWDKSGGMFSRSAVTNSLLGQIPKPATTKPPAQQAGTSIESLDKRLSLLFH
jgi:ATP-dependent Clp protease protease subunit